MFQQALIALFKLYSYRIILEKIFTLNEYCNVVFDIKKFRITEY